MNNVPLCVDLDGTLVRTNTLLETALGALKKNPLFIFKIVQALSKGKAYAKHVIGKEFSTNPSLLPYNKEFLEWLTKEKATGRVLILATASDELIAKKVAQHLEIFSDIIASTPKASVTAGGKALVLCKMFGTNGFSYAGNSQSDLAVWNCSHHAILVDAPKNIKQQINKNIIIEKEFITEKKSNFFVIAKTMRVHQWVKNALLFVPALAAHVLSLPNIATHAILGFISFSLLASAVYIFNDLTDISSDRAHQTKKYRPIASGVISLKYAIIISIVSALISTLIAVTTLPLSFTWLLALYVVINICYSLFAKKIAYIDILILASLYVLRVFAGSFATGVTTSKWLFVWTLCFFLSLAIMKRVIELLDHTKEEKIDGRGYHKRDRVTLEIAGMTSATLSVVILALYIKSSSIFTLYASPSLLWGIVGIVAIWLGRIWVLALQKRLPSDPVLFAAKDPVSYGAVCAIIAIMTIAS
jgi:4-hydroxybenzoate polyprenyltransferase/phosphoserine phosphatase